MMRGSDHPIQRILGSKAGLYKVSYIPLQEDGSLDDPSLYPAAEWVPKSTVPQQVIQKWREFRLSRSQDGIVRRAYLGDQQSTSFAASDSSRNNTWSDLSYNDLSSLNDITASAPAIPKQSAQCPITHTAQEKSTNEPKAPESTEIESSKSEAIPSDQPVVEVSAPNQHTPQPPIPADTSVVEHAIGKTTTSNTTRAEPITTVFSSAEPSAVPTPAEHGPVERSPVEHSSAEHTAEERAPEVRAAEERTAEERAPEERAPEERTAEERAPEERTAEERAPEERTAEERAPEERTAEERTAEERAPEERTAEERTPEERSDVEYSPGEYWAEENLPEGRSDEEYVAEEYLPEGSSYDENLPEERSPVEYSAEEPTPAKPVPVQSNRVEPNPEESIPVERSPAERSTLEVSPQVPSSIDTTTANSMHVEHVLAESTNVQRPPSQPTPVQQTSLDPAHQQSVLTRATAENTLVRYGPPPPVPVWPVRQHPVHGHHGNLHPSHWGPAPVQRAPLRHEYMEPAFARRAPVYLAPLSSSHSGSAPVHNAHPAPYSNMQPSRSSHVQHTPTNFARVQPTHVQPTHVQPASVKPSPADPATAELATTGPVPADIALANSAPGPYTTAQVDNVQSARDTTAPGLFTTATPAVKSDPNPPASEQHSPDVTIFESSSSKSPRMGVDTEDHSRQSTVPEEQSPQETFEDPMTDELPIETLIQERDRALRNARNSMDQLALLKNLYDTASDSAVESGSQLREAMDEIARLKKALEKGLASQHVFMTQTIQTKDEEIAALTQQNRLLVSQATGTNAAVRRKAALWEAHLERESEKENERQKRVAELERERQSYNNRVPVQGIPQHQGHIDEPETLSDELAELAAEAYEARSYESERPRKSRRLNAQ